MPDPGMAQFTTVFRATGDARRPKRNRQAVSCTGCQKRKSRCDRRQPCSGCERRGEACHFGPSPSQSAAAAAAAVAANPGGHAGPHGASMPRVEVQSRLNRLEEMVRGLAEGRRQAPQAEEKVDDAEEEYHGPTSWTALVDNIRDIKAALETEEAAMYPYSVDESSPDQPPPPPPPAHEPSVFMADHPPASLKDVLKALPPRPEADRLVSLFFNARFMALPVIHAHQFRRQYDSFWDDPAKSDMLWISILFSLLGAAVTISEVKGLPIARGVNTKSLLIMSGRCLASGQYLRPKPYAVEALLLHTYIRSMQKDDADSTFWSMNGLAIRLAQRRGYHRDATKVNPNLSFFEAEMRRRVWFICSAFDVLWSFHQGMPPAIVDDVCDTQHPSRLTDDDFDEDTIIPPQQRPLIDPLPITASHFKSHLCPIMRRIIWHALSVKTKPLSATMELNDQLQTWYESIPPCLRFRPIRSTAFTDAPHTIMHRIMLENLYRKCLCVLHRPYLTSVEDATEVARSREICREAALKIMDIHIQVDTETHPGGRLFDDRFMISNLTLHDFLIAAMIICLDLGESTDISAEDRAHHISLLQTAHQMWSARTSRSHDAALAVRVLRTILNRVETPASSASPTSQTLAKCTSSSDRSLKTPSTAPTPDVTTGLQSQGVFEAALAESQPFAEDYVANVNYDELPQLDSFFSNTEGLDWRVFDNYVLHNSDKMLLDEIMPDIAP